MALAASAAAIVTSWVVIAAGILSGSYVKPANNFPALIEVIASASFLGLLGGFIPALLSLWLGMVMAVRFQGNRLGFSICGSLAGLVWFSLAWPTRPGSPLWEAIPAEGDVASMILLLVTGQLLFAGTWGEELSASVGLAPLVGGAVGGLVYHESQRFRH
jgi:hypothetical protein